MKTLRFCGLAGLLFLAAYSRIPLTPSGAGAGARNEIPATAIARAEPSGKARNPDWSTTAAADLAVYVWLHETRDAPDVMPVVNACRE